MCIYDAWNRLVQVERHVEIFGNVAIRPLAPLDGTLDKQRVRLHGFDWELLADLCASGTWSRWKS